MTFMRRDYTKEQKKVSCTAKLNGWIVPRNLTVKAKPLKDIKVKKKINSVNKMSLTARQLILSNHAHHKIEWSILTLYVGYMKIWRSLHLILDFSCITTPFNRRHK